MRILICGLSKSGTSALFYKVRGSLPPGTTALFEPRMYGLRNRVRERLKAAVRGRLFPDTVAKILPLGTKELRIDDFKDFGRQVLIARDPRDRIVSLILYRAYHAGFASSERDCETFLRLLERKQASPLSVSLGELVETYQELDGQPRSFGDWLELYRTRGVQDAIEFHEQRPHLHLFRYEDMVDGRFSGLEAYLGMRLHGATQVDAQVRRVVRTKSYGGWRDWFTPADIQAVEPVLQPYLDRYYPKADWELSRVPTIKPEHGSDYVLRILDERRAIEKLPPLHRQAS